MRYSMFRAFAAKRQDSRRVGRPIQLLVGQDRRNLAPEHDVGVLSDRQVLVCALQSDGLVGQWAVRAGQQACRVSPGFGIIGPFGLLDRVAETLPPVFVWPSVRSPQIGGLKKHQGH